MSDLDHIQFRLATASDADMIAGLHADSWRRHYRGAYSDAYLDGDVAADRRRVWQDRLHGARHDSRTIVAEECDSVIGFSHVALDHHPTWGALLDNLHVVHTHARRGIGSRLLALTAGTVADHRPESGLYLWVLEQNAAAQAMYAANGGLCVECAEVEPPGGDRSRLAGTPRKLRYVWSDLEALSAGERLPR